MATTETAPKVAEPAKPREYVVLMETTIGDDEIAWTQVGTATATSREDALEQVVDKLPSDEQESTFIAVAARYWIKTTPVVEVKRTRSWK